MLISLASTRLRMLQNLPDLRFFGELHDFSLGQCEICDVL